MELIYDVDRFPDKMASSAIDRYCMEVVKMDVISLIYYYYPVYWKPLKV